MLRVNRNDLLKVVRRESTEYVNKVMKEMIHVPDLIGEGEKYSTL